MQAYFLRAATLISLLPAGSLLAAGPQPLTETRRIVDRPDERVCILDNGLTVILKAHRTAPVACVQMYCRTGSIYEQEYLGAGMSHLFEHLLHGGATSHRSEEESRRILDQIGGNTNAYTSYDVTCYFINTSRDHAAQAVNLLGDWITDPIFPQAAFEREWGVVQRELERDVDDPEQQIYYLTMETMYLHHPVRYPVIGYQPVVQSLRKADIVGYYHRMYVPDNIVVSIAGDIDLDAMVRTICTEFAGFRREKVPTIVLPEEPEMTTPRFASRPMRVQSAMLRMAWPTIPLTHPDLYALDVLSFILTQGDSSRLARTVRDTGLVFTIESSSYTPAWAKGIFVVSARLAPEGVDKARDAVLKQIALLQQELVSASELEKAKKQKAAEHTFATQTAESIASMMATDYLSTGDTHFSQAYVDKIQRITAEQIRDVARRYLVPERLGAVTVVPESGPATRPAAAETRAPQPVRLITLDNGLRCLIRRDPTTPLVAIQSYSLGGLSLENEKSNGLSRLASILLARGTRTRTAQDIAGFFDSRGGAISASSGNNALFVQAEVLKDDLGDALGVVADVILNPVFPKEELELFRPQLLDAIGQLDESWRPELFSYARHRFYRHSPYRFDELGSPGVIARATREEVVRCYQAMATAANSVLAVYGDVDPAAAEALVRRHFAAMPKGELVRPSAPPEPRLDGPQLFVLKKAADRKAAGIEIGFRGMTVRDRADRVEMAVLDTIISGYRYPTGWLQDALRGGNRNLVYEVHATNQPGILPGMFIIYAACQPDKVKEVYGIMSGLLDKARRGEFTEDELRIAKSIIVTSELMESQTNSARATQDCLNELYGLGYDYQEKFLKAIQAVSLDDVKRIARKYLTDPLIAVVTPTPDQVDIGIKPTAVDTSRTPGVATGTAAGGGQ